MSINTTLLDKKKQSPLIGNPACDVPPIEDENDESALWRKVQGFKDDQFRKMLYFFLAVISCGCFVLFTHWYPSTYIIVAKKKCPLASANWLIIERSDGLVVVEQVHRSVPKSNGGFQTVGGNPTSPAFKSVTYINHRYLLYVFDESTGNFVRPDFYMGENYSYIHDYLSKGHDSTEHANYAARFGYNIIDVPVKSYFRLLIDEILHPFYIFQIFSIALWIWELYFYYAGCILFLSVFSLTTELYKTRKHLVELHKMARFECPINVLRDGTWKEVSSIDLVPGDVVELLGNFILPCDVLLLSGQCVVNESMLTGESVPVSKSFLPHSQDSGAYDPEQDKKHTLYGGTKIIQTKAMHHNIVIGVVVRTGFTTAKGRLVRSILFPKESKFKFYEDSIKFLVVLAVIALLSFGYALYDLIHLKVETEEVIEDAGDLVTTVIPPALPAAMTIGTAFAINRLKNGLIYCISPPRVNVSGRIDVMCFDKTGTLTEDGLDVLGVCPMQSKKLLPMLNDVSRAPTPFINALASCHTLVYHENDLIGDPLEIKMFQATGWQMREPSRTETPTGDVIYAYIYPPNNAVVLGVVRKFEFSSKLQRMSVLVKDVNADGSQPFELYVKGAPEKIAEFCDPNTIPEDFSSVLEGYTHQGYRVLACAARLVDMPYNEVQRVSRNKLECDLSFLGFLVMENRLKPDTAGVITQLKEADIRCVMITGDNALTAISVARKCGLISGDHVVLADLVTENRRSYVSWKDIDTGEEIDPKHLAKTRTATISMKRLIGKDNYDLAVTGKAFHHLCYFEDTDIRFYEKILLESNIFARMSPDDKKDLVEDLGELNFTVGMCGDGANDCGALKAAQVGVSLSEAEASIAAPFTSKNPSISCIIKLLREGRAALTTSLECFKFMALYSMIQTFTVVLLYTIGSNLGDQQYLYIDLLIILPLAVFMSHTGAYNRLVKRRPICALISVPVLTSLAGQITISFIFQLYVWLDLHSQKWHIPLVRVLEDTDANILCTETTVMFVFSSFQYITVALAFSFGKPFRKEVYTNFWYTLSFILLTISTVFLLLYPEPVASFMKMKVGTVKAANGTVLFQLLPFHYRFKLLALVVANFVVSIAFEYFIVLSGFLSWLSKFLRQALRRA